MKGGLLNLHLLGELLAITHKRSYEAVCQVNVITEPRQTPNIRQLDTTRNAL